MVVSKCGKKNKITCYLELPACLHQLDAGRQANLSPSWAASAQTLKRAEVSILLSITMTNYLPSEEFELRDAKGRKR